MNDTLITWLGDRADALIPIAIIGAWLALQLWILPAMGVAT